jgi:hypothetical protein
LSGSGNHSKSLAERFHPARAAFVRQDRPTGREVAIYTRDRDFLRTTTPVILVAVDTMLQRYARASSIRIGFVLGSSFSVGFGLEALLALGRLLARLFQTARNLSPVAQALILAAIAAVIAHSKSRAKLLQRWDSLNRSLKPAMWEVLAEAMYQFAEATSTAEESYRALQQILPPPKRRPLPSQRFPPWS